MRIAYTLDTEQLRHCLIIFMYLININTEPFKKKNQKIKKLDQKIIRARIIILLLILIFIHHGSYNKSINSR